MNRYGMFRRAGAGCLVLASGFGALPAAADVSFTPRFGVFFDNASQRTSGTARTSPNTQAFLDQSNAFLNSYGGSVASKVITTTKSTQAAIPQFGGTLTFSWGEGGNTDIALTALYGETSVRGDTLTQNTLLSYSVAGVNAIDSLVQIGTYDSKYKRLDLEATVQHRLNETFSFVGGVRAERTTGDRPTTIVETGSANFLNALQNELNRLVVASGGTASAGTWVFPQGAPYTYDRHLEVWSYSVRGGAAAYAPIGEKQLLYVNGMLQLTHEPKAKITDTSPAFGTAKGRSDFSETSLGPEFSVGYMYRFSDRFGIDARYRATVYFPLTGGYEFKDTRIKHGLMLGFTTWFGGR